MDDARTVQEVYEEGVLAGRAQIMSARHMAFEVLREEGAEAFRARLTAEFRKMRREGVDVLPYVFETIRRAK